LAFAELVMQIAAGMPLAQRYGPDGAYTAFLAGMCSTIVSAGLGAICGVLHWRRRLHWLTLLAIQVAWLLATLACSAWVANWERWR
jgi:O-antigen/teichoic acid export membrane protein